MSWNAISEQSIICPQQGLSGPSIRRWLHSGGSQDTWLLVWTSLLTHTPRPGTEAWREGCLFTALQCFIFICIHPRGRSWQHAVSSGFKVVWSITPVMCRQKLIPEKGLVFSSFPSSWPSRGGCDGSASCWTRPTLALSGRGTTLPGLHGLLPTVSGHPRHQPRGERRPTSWQSWAFGSQLKTACPCRGYLLPEDTAEAPTGHTPQTVAPLLPCAWVGSPANRYQLLEPKW